MKFDAGLIQFATVRQLEYIEAIEKCDSMSEAGRVLGVNPSSVTRSIAYLHKHAARQGYSPEHHLTRTIAPGLKLRGTSQLFKAGQAAPVMEWVKTTADEAQREQAMRDFAQSLCEDIKPIAPTPAPEGFLDEDLLPVIPMGDPHFGMYAWWQDAGDDFDLEHAKRLTNGAIDRLVASSPNAATAILLNLGDMFHMDNQKNVSQSGHQLDVDGRWAKVQQVGLQSMIYCIRRMLTKYGVVVVRINRGNHDGHSAYALALMIDAYFHEEPRVQVDLSPQTMWYYQFGKVLIGSTHGDTIKGPDMVPIMASDMPVAWGETKHRHIYVGHIHHSDVKEYRGGTVEYFRTLAARDAWHQGQGYRAGRDMRLIVHHREHGEIERHRCDVGMIQ